MTADRRFTPLTPALLVEQLADWIERHGPGPGTSARSRPAVEPSGGPAPATVIGFDGPEEAGTPALADAVADRLVRRGRAAVRASTASWWRPAALRLELGREDVDMLLTGWLDDAALRRELIHPLRAGAGEYLTALRDPVSGRPARQQPRPVPDAAVLLLDGPFLLAADLDLDGLVGIQVGTGTLRRVLPPDRAWWRAAFDRYRSEYGEVDGADVLISYDHPAAPAARGLGTDS